MSHDNHHHHHHDGIHLGMILGLIGAWYYPRQTFRLFVLIWLAFLIFDGNDMRQFPGWEVWLCRVIAFILLIRTFI